MKFCESIKKTTKHYGLRDFPKFARNNCSIIRIYFRKVSCEDIVNIADFCFNKK